MAETNKKKPGNVVTRLVLARELCIQFRRADYTLWGMHGTV